MDYNLITHNLGRSSESGGLSGKGGFLDGYLGCTGERDGTADPVDSGPSQHITTTRDANTEVSTCEEEQPVKTTCDYSRGTHTNSL